MVKNIVWAVVFCIIAGILQSSLIARFTLHHYTPDLTLGILVYTAYLNGTMTGQITGFLSGVFLDFLSMSPLGLFTFIRTIIGALAGLLRGAFFLDRWVLPMVLTGTATLLRALLLFLLRLLFGADIPFYSFVERDFWVSLCLNIFTAPFLFMLLRQFESLLVSGREL
jgi:rod shape-determining protein MreD